MQKKILVVSFQSLTENSAQGIGQLAYEIAKELHRKDCLQALIVSSKGKFTSPFPSLPVHKLSRYYLFILNKLFSKLRLKSHVSRYIQEVLYDKALSLHVSKNTGALVVTTSFLYHTFKKAKKLNIPISFIPGNPDDNYIHEIVAEENKKYNIKNNDGYTYAKRLHYYNKSIGYIDHFITYSSVMEESYRIKGHKSKLIPGYLKPVFNAPVRIQSEDKFKVSFLAYTVLLKGLQYMLEAWRELQYFPDIELHIGGPIDKNVQDIIDRDFWDLKHVYYHHKITDIPSFFADKSIYVLSSIIDGAPVSVLEAMACEVPVICTENCGTKDIIEEGKSGWVIPVRNSEVIKEKILEAYNDRQKTRQMGKYAKTVIEHYEMGNFVNKIIEEISKHIRI